MKTYTPLPKKEYKLAAETVAREKAIHALQVRYPGVSLEERQAICKLQKWKPEERIPELSGDIRVSVSALQQMLKRNEKMPEQTHTDLTAICDRHVKDHRPVGEQITAEEYWYELACILLDGFSDEKDVNKEDLNFKQIQEAYLDFFG